MVTRIFFCSLLWICSTSVFAQDDTLATSRARDTSEEVSQPAVPGEQSPMLLNREAFTEENTIKLQREHLPPALLKVLDDPQYEGWENGEVLRNILTGHYKIDITKADKTESFLFDRNGERLDEN